MLATAAATVVAPIRGTGRRQNGRTSENSTADESETRSARRALLRSALLLLTLMANPLPGKVMKLWSCNEDAVCAGWLRRFGRRRMSATDLVPRYVTAM